MNRLPSLKTHPAAPLLAAVLVLTGCAGSPGAAAPDTAGMVVRDGMARQIVRYTDAQVPDYSNEGSDILRFCVYVETDHDTDLDGLPDLIKTVVQLPRPAAEGQYKAPVIYEARPYIAGMYGYTPDWEEVGSSSFDEGALYKEPAKRVPSGEITTLELASAAEPADWFYTLDADPFGLQYIGNFKTYDDLLVCGFAVVQSAGLGTYGSEGIECCTSNLEAEAFACVIDWLCGRRNAYSDLTGTVRVTADWCSGRIGMTGRSYAAAMAVEVASLAPEGLETIVPVAAPASWYDYTNSQGLPNGLHNNYDFAADLSVMCASRMFDDPAPEMKMFYDSYLSRLRDEQIRAAGDYNTFWEERNYLRSDSFRTSALIVQGLHDVTVHPKQFDLLRRALERSGCEVRCLLHQNGHVTPANEQTQTDIMIGDRTYTELMNLWFTHYLLDADNEIRDLPVFTVQSNVDGTFYGNDSWNNGDLLEIEGMPGEQTVSAAGAHLSNQLLLSDTFDSSSGPDHLLLGSAPAEEDLTIAGVTEVRLCVKTPDPGHPFPMLAAVLVDTADEPFAAYDVEWSEVLDQEVLQEKGAFRGEGVTPYDLVSWRQVQKDRQVIAYGSMDLRDPAAGYEASGAASPTEPIDPDRYYSYTLYLQPAYYTVQAGHRLELYVVPYCGFSNDTAFYDECSEEELRELGFDPACMLPLTRDYSFTVDTGMSSVQIPIISQ